MMLPSESLTWPGPTSETPVPSRSVTPALVSTSAAYAPDFVENALSNELP